MMALLLPYATPGVSRIAGGGVIGKSSSDAAAPQRQASR